MPWDEVPSKFAQGDLHSGSATGPKVKSRKQEIAILLSEKAKAAGGNTEYASKSPKSSNPIDGLKKAKP